MACKLPATVTLIEVGPRDGFQFEKRLIPTDLKLAVIEGLVAAGMHQIQVTSFVHPAKVPQMADAEELIRRLPRKKGVVFSGLALNVRGVERAHAAGLEDIEISVSASDTHSRRNAGMSQNEALVHGREMIRLAEALGMRVRFSIQCAFGCVYEGKPSTHAIVGMIREARQMGRIAMLSLADTTGMADPCAVMNLLEAVDATGADIPVALHLHDTRGMGLANVCAALRCGVTHFDTALGGMGGCPFVPGAAGNIATEDTAHMLAAMKIVTGCDIRKVSACSQRLARFLEKELPGKIYRLHRN